MTLADDHEAMPMLKDLEPGKLDDNHVVALMIDPVDDNHADLAMCISHHDHCGGRWVPPGPPILVPERDQGDPSIYLRTPHPCMGYGVVVTIYCPKKTAQNIPAGRNRVNKAAGETGKPGRDKTTIHWK